MLAKWNCKEFKITKYENETDYENGKVSDICRYHGNVVTLNGLRTLWHLINGTNPSDSSKAYPFNKDNTFIGVGTGGAVASRYDATLSGSDTAYSAISATEQSDQPVFNYSVTESKDGQSMTISAQFGSDKANFAWNEWGIFNGDPSNPSEGRKASSVQSYSDDTIEGSLNNYNIVMLNHKVETMGTKAPGSIWEVQVTISLSN